MKIEANPRTNALEVSCAGHLVIAHSPDRPAVSIGTGTPDVRMYRGNFDIQDKIDARVELRHATLRTKSEGLAIVDLAEVPSSPVLISLTFREGRAGEIRIDVDNKSNGFNRFWIRVPAGAEERVWGGGEQMSYFNMRGRRFPLWTSEPGVGRDKSRELTQIADKEGMAGGDYWTTNYPQPTFLSSARYALHVDSNAYAVFDFCAADWHEIEVWEIPAALEFYRADSFTALVGRMADRFGRQPQLPDWAISGAIIGLKDGEESFKRLETILDAGAKVTGLWCEDWVGIRNTSFGKRLFWDWRWNKARYPDLDRQIKALEDRGIRYLGYVNPYLCNDGHLYKEAAAAGYLALRPDADEIYLVDFGEFDAGVVDFTNSAACAWFADRVIGQEMIDFGLSGWMADFGEYLPTDVRLASGLDPMIAHNAWPALWAKVNADAVASRRRRGDIVFFMRAGGAGVQAHCPLLWAGDQCVDFSRHDGLGTTITAALSAGLLGNAYSHSDIGGYTSLYGNVRTAELIMRWTEMAAFTPVMRTHEGNRPADNLQIDSSPDILAHFAAMTRVHAALAPYTREVCAAAEAEGLPAQRPLFLHFEDAPECFDIQDQYLYGPDLLVAPIVEEDTSTRQVYLPNGTEWVHFWSGADYASGRHEIAAPIGFPPVFYRKNCSNAGRFRAIADEHRNMFKGTPNV